MVDKKFCNVTSVPDGSDSMYKIKTHFNFSNVALRLLLNHFFFSTRMDDPISMLICMYMLNFHSRAHFHACSHANVHIHLELTCSIVLRMSQSMQ